MATQVTPSAAVRRESLEGLASQGLTPSGEVHWNFVAPELVEAAIRRGEGRLAEMGPFVAVTSPHTGRSPNDKFVVQERGMPVGQRVPVSLLLLCFYFSLRTFACRSIIPFGSTAPSCFLNRE